jgi:cell division protein FtsL
MVPALLGWLLRPATRVASVLGAAVLVSGLLVVDSSHRTRNLFMESERLRLERDDLIARRGRLLLEKSAFSAYNRVETLATERLSMRMPEPGDTRLVPAPEQRP